MGIYKLYKTLGRLSIRRVGGGDIFADILEILESPCRVYMKVGDIFL